MYIAAGLIAAAAAMSRVVAAEYPLAANTSCPASNSRRAASGCTWAKTAPSMDGAGRGRRGAGSAAGCAVIVRPVSGIERRHLPMEPPVGFEPTTIALQERRSTVGAKAAGGRGVESIAA